MPHRPRTVHQPDDNASRRVRAWQCKRLETDRSRFTVMLVKSVVSASDRIRAAANTSRVAYVGAALLAMEGLSTSERQALIARYAALHDSGAA
ncbi:hypothetical protein [Paraburkholderia dilworthii]|uniref:Uncharacterized protein n=1 Tax=Paraburkholderia dilworthii TaxID=948106 RepID=A0ABW9D6Q1_9BURK